VTAVALVALGAALGAPARYLTDRLIQARHDSLFPWGTFAVNVAGSFLLGLLAGIPVSEPVMAAVGIGFCGALTTYSTFGYETVRLAQVRARFYAAVNATASVLAGLGAAYCGLALAQALTT
jgi:fluoride exporter